MKCKPSEVKSHEQSTSNDLVVAYPAIPSRGKARGTTRPLETNTRPLPSPIPNNANQKIGPHRRLTTPAAPIPNRPQATLACATAYQCRQRAPPIKHPIESPWRSGTTLRCNHLRWVGCLMRHAEPRPHDEVAG